MRCNKKKIYILFVIVALLCVSVGYSVLNSTLIINGKSNISKNTWNVHFENIKITNGSVTASVEPAITNNTTISNFELTLDKPGDFYEFTVDVKNTGTIDAMINSVVRTPDLTENQKKYIDYIVEYQNGEDILKNQLVKANELVRIKVRVSYKKDLSSSDLPTVAETLTLGLDINYIQADESGVEVFGRGITFVDGDINEIGTIVTIGTEQFYTIGTEAGNAKLLSMYNLHVGSEVKNVSFETFEIDISEISNPTGMQSSEAKGIIFDDNGSENVSFPFIGVTAFSSEEKHGTKYNDYSGSIIEEYVNNYKTKLEDNFDIDIVNARLITNEELTNSETFACSLENERCSNDLYSWIHLTSYWTESAFDMNDVLAVYNDNYFDVLDSSINYVMGVRPVIEVSLKELGIKDFSPVAYGDINEIGTVVTIGTEKFYTIGTEGDNVKLLSKYNLYVGHEIIGVDDETYEIDMIEIPDSTGMQSYKAIGILYEEDSNGNGAYGYPSYGVTEFANEEKHGINYSDYEGSVVEEYVNNYVYLLRNMYNVDVIDGRIINDSEFLSLVRYECDHVNVLCSKDLYPWLYTTSYWTSHVYDENSIYFISVDGIGNYAYDFIYFFGVRPVIVLPKSYFE